MKKKTLQTEQGSGNPGDQAIRKKKKGKPGPHEGVTRILIGDRPDFDTVYRTTRSSSSRSIRNKREYWQWQSQCSRVSPRSLREFLATDWQDAPLTENQSTWLRALQQAALPEDECFWQAFQEAWQIIKNAEQRLMPAIQESPRIWSGEYFLERFSKHRRPSNWVPKAGDALFLLNAFQMSAQMNVSGRSRYLRTLFESSKAVKHNKQKAPSYHLLLVAVQEWLPAPWVEEEIRKLRFQGIAEPDSEKREFAKNLLQQIEKARKEKAGRPRSPKRVKQENKRVSNSKAGKKRNNEQTADRWWKKYTQEKESLLGMGRTEDQAEKEANRYIIDQFDKTSRAKDKDAILTILEEKIRIR